MHSCWYQVFPLFSIHHLSVRTDVQWCFSIVELLALIPHLTVCEVSTENTSCWSHTALSSFSTHQSAFHKRLRLLLLPSLPSKVAILILLFKYNVRVKTEALNWVKSGAKFGINMNLRFANVRCCRQRVNQRLDCLAIIRRWPLSCELPVPPLVFTSVCCASLEPRWSPFQLLHQAFGQRCFRRIDGGRCLKLHCLLQYVTQTNYASLLQWLSLELFCPNQSSLCSACSSCPLKS